MPGEEAVLELRPLYEMADFGDNVTPEVRERDTRLTDAAAAAAVGKESAAGEE